MWSHLYYYFEIKADAEYSKCVNTLELVAFMESELLLERKGEKGFGVSDTNMWAEIVIDKTIDGSFSGEGPCPDSVNLISVVGSKLRGKRTDYIKLFSRVAEKFDWVLVEEEDDDGNENVILWPLMI